MNRLKSLYKRLFWTLERQSRDAGVKLGHDNFIASRFWSSEPYLITIGSHCQITAGVKIFTHGGGQILRNKHPKFDSFGKVLIGDYVYLGNNVLVMPGVEIGDNVLIAAGSVVTKSIPSDCVVAGNPARYVCSIEEYEQRNLKYNTNSKGMNAKQKKEMLESLDDKMFVKKDKIGGGKIVRRIKRAFTEPRILARWILDRIVRLLPDRVYLQLKFWLCVGYWPNLKNPRTYNEKLQWLKLYDYREEYTQMVDKVAAKDYVSSIVGDKYVIPTLGVYDTVEDIDWDKLPRQFVVKSANDSGGVVVCKDKSTLDIEAAKEKLKNLGGRDYTVYSKEYPYKNVPHRLLAEQYMEDESGFELKDYKIFCFDGEPKFLFVATGRQANDTRFDFYDMEFNHLDVLNGHDCADVWPTKPQNFDEMLEVARKLSKGIPHVRVDLYNINGNIYFGELTFFHWSGMVPFKPVEWDYKFGEYLKLPDKNIK